jgi:SAM-dependent methyltransferase
VESPPRGLTFGRGAADYEYGRPAWPDAAVERAGEALELDRSATVVDLAAGTGKLTRALVPRFERVIAVEPDASMRAFLVQATDRHLVVEGTAEAMPLADESADAVFVADAFHWFANDTAVAEIARVIRPRGGLAILRAPWRRDSFEPPLPGELLAELEAAHARAEARTTWGPRYATDEWFELLERGGFEPPRAEVFETEIVLDAGQVASLWLSVSSVTMLPRDERATLGEKLRRALSGTYRLALTTDLHWTRLAA